MAWTTPKFWSETASSEPGLWMGNSRIQPGALSGEPVIRTADSGNVVRCTVHPCETMGSTFSPPGSNWTAQRTTGVKPRRIDIVFHIAVAAFQDTSALEGLLWMAARIDWLIQTQKDRTLMVSDGRSSAVRIYDENGELVKTKPGGAVLLPTTGPVSRRLMTPDGKAVQTWMLRFLVLNAAGMQRVNFDGGGAMAGGGDGESGNEGGQSPRGPA